MAALRRVSKAIAFVPGAALMRQGQAARGAYFIESGEVEARVALPGGGELAVARLGPGSVLGEMALLEQGIVSATVVARTGVNALLIERDDFRALVAQRDEAVAAIQHAVCLVLAEKLRALNAKVLACAAPEDLPARDEPAGDPLAAAPRRRAASFDYRRFLPLLAVFAEFGEDDIDEVLSRAKLLELPRGHAVFTAGQPAGSSYIVVRGALEIDARRGNARSCRLAVAAPGEWVGVLSQLEGGETHGSSARARENCVLLEIDREAFKGLYGAGSTTSARVQRAIHRSLLQSLRRTNNHLTRLISQERIRSHRESASLDELQSALYGQLCHTGG
jgi:CRP/FNR family cyclic AMP-dependent transcriptional regulator